ncbi:MAG: phosphoribosylanthranilate isomerase [Acidibrevibacterium sp.]|uniref:phosphoribosylanthranilate isomerase n=1 Tax=Acidibrevibacterium sp. TaxID=2606776 RepID=UPI003D063095
MAGASRVKICGINCEAAFDAAVAAGADWLGFVFFPPSPRAVSAERAAKISAREKAGPPRVGLFVNPSFAEIAAVLAVIPLDILQIHGPAAMAAAIRAEFGRPVWRAVGIATAADLPADPEGADALLLDASPPRGATRPGGNAVAFDWHLLRDWHPPAPWLLAGGLTPENVAAAIAMTGAPAVDVSSGVERRPGEKDPALIRAFIAAAHGESRR